jgi:hypothetical protein
MSLTAEKLPQKRNDDTETQPRKIGWRINEWSRATGCSKATTYRRIADGTLKVRRYGDITLIIGFAGDESADSSE